MIFHPAVIALLTSSFLIVAISIYSSAFAVQILRSWDIESGKDQQLILERKTYLISTFLTYLFSFQLLSLFLYVFTVDHMHIFFVGAMCAAGTLNVNSFGYPALIFKIFNFIAIGLWLIWNYADNKAYDYPLIRNKYLFLVILTPFLIAESFFQTAYFLKLRPDIITSCCGSLFSSSATGLGAGLASIPAVPAGVALFIVYGLIMAAGIIYLLRRKGAYYFASLCAGFFLLCITGIISFLSIYIYELPSHHCPFCLMHQEYHYIGYPLYISLFSGTLFGLGVGILEPFRRIGSLSSILPRLQNKMTILSLILFSICMIIIVFELLASGLQIRN